MKKTKGKFTVLLITAILAALTGCSNPANNETFAPNAPAAPSVTAADSRLTLSWTAVGGAMAYEVWYGTTDDSGAAEKHGEDITGVTTTINSLTNDTTYYVWIKAKNDVGISGFSPSASGTPQAAVVVPAAPAAPTVTAGDEELTLSWIAVSGATAYEVWHGTTDDSDAAEKHGGDITGLSAAITGLNNGTICYVWIKAKNDIGISGFSPSASGTPQAAVVVPAAPAAPTVTAGDEELTLSWMAVDGATAYEVWHGTTDDSGAAEKYGEDITGLSATITGLAGGTTYYVWVKAKNSAGTSGFSPSALIVCDGGDEETDNGDIYVPGIYTGIAPSVGGDITASVVFSGNQILDVTVVSQTDTLRPSIIQRVIETVTEAILVAQSTDVDTVTGATVSSRRIMNAVEECAEQARIKKSGSRDNVYLFFNNSGYEVQVTADGRKMYLVSGDRESVAWSDTAANFIVTGGALAVVRETERAIFYNVGEAPKEHHDE